MNNSVIIVGRMNVGKSTLFNRLSTSVKSITLDYAGVTRDFVRDSVTWRDCTFELIDSGGMSFHAQQDELLEQVRQRVVQLLDKGRLILFVADGIVGLLPEDRTIARILHKLGKPVIVVVNKTDSQVSEEHRHEFEQLGFSTVIPISAQHGININELLDAIVGHLPTCPSDEEKPAFQVVFLGRPNVGKSSLMNCLLQEERLLVSDIPGTTREAVSENINFYRETIQLTDTPGIRKKKAIDGILEPLMVKSSLRAAKDTDIVALVIDAHEAAFVDQELKLAFYAFEQLHKSLLLIINKHDLMTPFATEELQRRLDYYKHLIDKVPVITTSCQSGKNVGKLLPALKELWQRTSQRFDDTEIDRIIKSALTKRPLYRAQQQLFVYRAFQVASAPITIVLEVNEPRWFEESQLNFFDNILRAEFSLQGVPIKFLVRKKG